MRRVPVPPLRGAALPSRGSSDSRANSRSRRVGLGRVAFEQPNVGLLQVHGFYDRVDWRRVGDRLPHLYVIERLHLVVEPKDDSFVALDRRDLHSGLTLALLPLARVELLGDVNRAGEQELESRRRRRHLAPDHPRDLRLLTVIIGVDLEHDLLTGGELRHSVGSESRAVLAEPLLRPGIGVRGVLLRLSRIINYGIIERCRLFRHQ